MIDSIPHHINGTGPKTTGWLVSCLLHGSLAVGAVLFMQHMQLAPQEEPFKWDVAMVTPSPIAALLTPEASVPPELAKTPPPTQAAHRSTPLTPTPQPVIEPPRPIVETPAPPPPTAAPTMEKPAPPAPTVPAPTAAEFTSHLAPEHTLVPKPRPPIDPMSKQPDLASLTPQETTPVSAVPASLSQKFEPSSQSPSTPLAEQTPTVHDDAATTHSETQTAHQFLTASVPSMTTPAPAVEPTPAKVDYGWLTDLMGKWIESLDKRYPAMLRTEGIQGKVTLTALLHADGMLTDVRVAKSSGNELLDQVAVEDVRKGPPVVLSRSLEQAQKLVKFSISYDLKTIR